MSRVLVAVQVVLYLLRYGLMDSFVACYEVLWGLEIEIKWNAQLKLEEETLKNQP